MFWKPVFSFVVFIHVVVKGDDYVEEVFQKCNVTKLEYECDKYKFLKFLEDFDFQWIGNGFVNLVRIPIQEVAPFPLATYRNDDTEYVKFLKFLKRKTVQFLGTHSLAFQLPKRLGGTIQGRSLEETPVAESKTGARSRFTFLDKKKLKILSKIILFKLLNIKIMLANVLFVILMVKKLLLFAALMYPFVYQEYHYFLPENRTGVVGMGVKFKETGED